MSTSPKPKISNQIANGFIFSIVDKLFTRLAKRPSKPVSHRSSKIVYHYTTVDTLYKIISSESLLATNILYLNDTAEYKHTKSLFKISLEDLQESKRTSLANKKVISELLAKIDDIELSQYYVTCFSASRDLLSQWIAYGERGHGVAIGFNRDRLQRCFQYIPVDAWVEYDIYKQIDRVKVIHDEFFKNYSQLAKEVLFENEGQKITLAVEIYLKHLLPTFLSHYKNSSFREENEYRLALRNDSVTPLDIDFYVKKSQLIVPYTKLVLKGRFFNDTEDDFLDTLAEKPTFLLDKLPIEELILGPCLDKVFAEPGIKMFLKRNGYDNIKISSSSIPYRNI
jgi:hypothetical protein